MASAADSLVPELLERLLLLEQLEQRWHERLASIGGSVGYAGREALREALAFVGGYLAVGVVHSRGVGPGGALRGTLYHHPDAQPEQVAELARLLGEMNSWLFADHAHLIDRGQPRIGSLTVSAEGTGSLRRDCSTKEPLALEPEEAEKSWRRTVGTLEFGARNSREIAEGFARLEAERAALAELAWAAWPQLLENAGVRWWDLVWAHGQPDLLFTIGPGQALARRAEADEQPTPALVVLEQTARLLSLEHLLDPARIADSALWHLSALEPGPQPLAGPGAGPGLPLLTERVLLHAHFDPSTMKPPELWPEHYYGYEILRNCACGQPYLAHAALMDRHLRCDRCAAKSWLGLLGPGERVRGCGEGWHNPILFAALRCLAIDDRFRIDDIKEKYGDLSFYAGGSQSACGVLTDWVERISGTLCEQCGAAGEMRDGGWIKCLCDQCAGFNVPGPQIFVQAEQPAEPEPVSS